MKLNAMQKFLLKLTPVAMLAAGSMVSLGASAAGFQNIAHSADGLGRAYAGEGAITDNASALAKNPAVATEFKDQAVSVSAVYVHPDVEMNNPTVNGSPVSGSNSDADDPVDPATSPAIAYIKDLGRLGVGVSVRSDYGSKTDYANNYFADEVAGKTDLKTYNLGLNVAYEVTPKLSVGAAINIVEADAELDRGNKNVKLSGDDTSTNFQAGILYKPAPGHHYAVMYQSRTQLNLEGKASVFGRESNASADIELPEKVEVAGSNALSANTSVHYTVAWTRWSRLQSLIAKSDSGTVLFGSEGNQERVNQVRTALGVSHQLSPAVTLRAGVALDKGTYPDDMLRYSSPDADRMWYSAGMSYNISPNSSLDLGLTYVDLEDEELSEKGSLTGRTYTVDQEISAYLVGAQYNVKF